MDDIKECKICNFTFCPDLLEDVKTHRKRHDEAVNGIKAPAAKHDKILWYEGQYRITITNQLSPKYQRVRAEKVARLGNRETRYDFPPYTADEPLDDKVVHLFVLYHQSRAVGILVLSRREDIWGGKWEDIEKKELQKLEKHVPIWTVDFIWVLKKHRGYNLAKKLIKAAANYFEFEIEHIGWYPPFSNDGKYLSKSICPNYVYMAR